MQSMCRGRCGIATGLRACMISLMIAHKWMLPSLFTALAGSIAGRLLPAQCCICRAQVMDLDAMCPACWNRLQFIDKPCCERSGVPLPYDTGPGTVSPAALRDPPDWNRARAAVVFDDHSRRLVHALKYHDRHEVALMMARMMARAGTELLGDANLLVPVPLYRWRLWTRRFNQSALLAQKIAIAGNAEYRPDILLRHKPTRAQVGLDHAARRRNVNGAFIVEEARRPDLAGRNAVLIDDVITTGATAGACARALTRAGAARVDVLTFALVQTPARSHI